MPSKYTDEMKIHLILGEHFLWVEKQNTAQKKANNIKRIKSFYY